MKKKQTKQPILDNAPLCAAKLKDVRGGQATMKNPNRTPGDARYHL